MRRERMTYTRLSFITGLSRGYLCNVAKGRRRPSREAALAIADALKMRDPRRLYPPQDRQAA